MSFAAKDFWALTRARAATAADEARDGATAVDRLADQFGVPIDGVRVVSRLIGGGFGAKGSAWFPCFVLGVLAARHAGRPVALELTRAEMFTLVGRRQEPIQGVRVAATARGALTP